MKIGIIVLLIINLILVSVLINRKRQMKDICRQLSFFRENNSNMLISCGNRAGGMGELSDQLNLLASDTRKRNRNYMDKEKNIAEIYTNLSHDIRTPLTSLEGYFQLLQDCDNDADKTRYINIIRERIKSLNNMLEELFTYTKLKNEDFELELTSVNLTKLLKETILSYYEDWSDRGIKPYIRIPHEVCFVRGNEQALKRTIQNIIKNVLVHGEKDIIISLERENQAIRLSISNQVMNPDEIDADRVFERFYKADEARQKNSTGLGLSIAYGFVKRMQGNISATVEGNMFSIVMEFQTI